MKNKVKQIKNKSPNPTMILLVTLGILMVSTYYIIILKGQAQQENTYKEFSWLEVPDSMVCMISNSIKQSPTNAFDVNGKIFFGCCPSCGSKLIGNFENSQYSTDPLTKKTISKADAEIRLIPGHGNTVVYFESLGNYEEFLKIISSE